MTEFKGSILELNNKHAIVMTEKCDFITIKRMPEMFVGQQLILKRSDIKRKTASYLRYATLAASVFVLALFSILYFQVFNPNTVFAYIDVDINPSLEFAIDSNSNVLSVKALNADAETLVKELELKKLPVKEAISKVIDTSKEFGYISTEKNNEVLISATLQAEENSGTYFDNEKALDNILSDIKKITVQVGTESVKPEVLKVTPENRKSAVENNISMGRYELYKKIKEKNSDITLEKAKSERVSEMLDKAEVKKAEKDNKKTGSPSDDSKGNGKVKDKDKEQSDKSNDEETFKPDKTNKIKKSDKAEKQNNNEKKSESDKNNQKDNSKKIKPKDKSEETEKNKPDKNNKNSNDKPKSQSDSDWPKSYSDKNSDNNGTGSDNNSDNNNEKNKEQSDNKNNNSPGTYDNEKNPSGKTNEDKHKQNDNNHKNNSESNDNSGNNSGKNDSGNSSSGNGGSGGKDKHNGK